MYSKRKFVCIVAGSILAGAAALANAVDINVTLTGAEEVPPVATSASGSGTITIGDDKSVSGSVTTTGIVGIAAHIHEGAPNVVGKVIVPFQKKGDNVWGPAAGAKLTDEQYQSFLAGNLYVNVHSEANKVGEIRGVLKP